MPRGDNGAGVETALPPPPPFGPYNGQGPIYGIQAQATQPIGVQQLPYQQGMMGGRGNPNLGGFYAPPLQAGFGAYNGSGAPPSVDAYRNAGMPNGNGTVQPPIGDLAGQASFVPPGYNMGTPYGYGGPPPPFMPDQLSGAGGNGRRGRSGRNQNRDISPRQFH